MGSAFIKCTGEFSISKSTLSAPIEPTAAEKVLWLKADVGVTYNGSNLVTLWEDQSGGGNDVIPYNTGYEPLRVNNSILSLPTIRFKDDGSTKLLVTPNFYSISYNSPISILAVLKANSSEIASGDSQRWLLPDGSSGSFELGFTFGAYSNSNRNFSVMVGNNLVGETNIQSDTISGTETAIVSLVNTGSEVSFYKNGTLVGTTNPATYSGTNSTSGVWGIGAQMSAGNIYLSAKFNLAELIMYSGAVSSQQLGSDINYLNGKWGVYGNVFGLKFDGNTNDYYQNYTFTNNSNASINTSTKKYGSGSLQAHQYIGGTLYAGRCSTGTAVIPSLSSGDWTVECWVYRPTDYTSNRQGIISFGRLQSGSITYSGFNFYYYAGDGGIIVNNGLAADIGSGTLPVGEWVHLAVTWDNSSGIKTLYVNGVVQATGSQNMLSGPYRANIGNIDAAWSGDPFGSDILIDDVRVSSRLVYTGPFTPSEW